MTSFAVCQHNASHYAASHVFTLRPAKFINCTWSINNIVISYARSRLEGAAYRRSLTSVMVTSDGLSRTSNASACLDPGGLVSLSLFVPVCRPLWIFFIYTHNTPQINAIFRGLYIYVSDIIKPASYAGRGLLRCPCASVCVSMCLSVCQQDISKTI